MKKIFRFIKKNFILIFTLPVILGIIWVSAVRCSALSGDYDISLESFIDDEVTFSYNSIQGVLPPDNTFSAQVCSSSPSLVSYIVHFVIPANIFYNETRGHMATPAEMQYINNYFNSFENYSIPALVIGDNVSYVVNYANYYSSYSLYSNFTDYQANLQGEYFSLSSVILLNVTVSYTCYPDLNVQEYFPDSVNYPTLFYGNYNNSSSGIFLNLNFSDLVVPFPNDTFCNFSVIGYGDESFCYYRIWITDIICPANNPIYSNFSHNSIYGVYLSSYDNIISSSIYFSPEGYSQYKRRGTDPLIISNNVLGYGDYSINAPNASYVARNDGHWYYNMFREYGGDYDFRFSKLRLTHNYYESSGKRYFLCCSVNKKSSHSELPFDPDIKQLAFAFTYTLGANNDNSSVGSGTSSGMDTKDLYITIDYNFGRDGISPIFTRVIPQAFNNAVIWFMTEAPISGSIVQPLFSTITIVVEFLKGYVSPVFVACGAIGGVGVTVLIIAVIVRRFS